MARPSDPPADSRSASVANRTRAILGELSPGERKVGRALLATYPVAGLETVADLAERANVSAPTVLRFAGRLGYASYPAFQQALMREVHEQMGSPIRRVEAPSDAEPDPGSLDEASSAYLRRVAETFEQLPRVEVERAVDLIIDSRLKISIVGGRFSQVLATYLANHLVLIRRGVRVMPADRLQRDAALLDLGKRDLLIVFDYRRYDADVVDLAAAASQKGVQVVLFTDPWLSPVSDIAVAVLPAQVEAFGPFDSLAPAMALVETLVAMINVRVDGGSLRRMRELERLDPAADVD